MKRFSVVSCAVFCAFCLLTSGCGNEPSAPSASEIENFVNANPEMMEETKSYEVDLDDFSTEADYKGGD